MIGQILYIRDGDLGYKQLSSQGLTNEECNSVINKTHTINNYLNKKLNDDVYYICKQENGEHRYLIKITHMRQGGRLTNVYHILVLNENDYLQYINIPVKLFNFSNKNFNYSKVYNSGYLRKIDDLLFDENNLVFNKILQKYSLDNRNFSHFISCLYYSIIFTKKYSFGLYLDGLKKVDVNFKELSYVIFSLLPDFLRSQISIGSSTAPNISNIDIQFLGIDDNKQGIDIVYCINDNSIHSNIEIECSDLYLDSLFLLDETRINSFFQEMKCFINSLTVDDRNDKNIYLMIKYFLLNKDIEYFNKMNIVEKINFINNILDMKSREEYITHKFILQLLETISLDDYRNEILNIYFRIYFDLNEESSDQRQLLCDNILEIYNKCTLKEKIENLSKICQLNILDDKQLFELINKYSNEEIRLIYNEILAFYNDNNKTQLCELILKKISNIFCLQNSNDKLDMFNMTIQIVSNTEKKQAIISKYINDDDTLFLKEIINCLVQLFDDTSLFYDEKFRLQLKEKIFDILKETNEDFIMTHLEMWIKKYNSDIFDEIFVFCIHLIKNHELFKDNEFFMKWIQERNSLTNNDELKYIYYELLFEIDNSKIIDIIDDIYKISNKDDISTNDCQSIEKIVKIITDKKIEFNYDTLSKLLSIIYTSFAPFKYEIIYPYLNDIYLSKISDDILNIYEYLEKKCQNIYNDPYLNLENKQSYDYYLSKKIELEDILLNIKSKTIIDRINIDFIKKIDKNKFCESTYNKICKLIDNNLKIELDAIDKDNDKFDYIQDAVNSLKENSHLSFFNKFSKHFENVLKEHFWKNTSYNTFAYENRDIYQKLNIDGKYNENNKYILATKLDEFIQLRNWDDIYEFFFKNTFITDKNILKQVKDSFILECKEKEIDDIDFIVFANFENKQELFEKLYEKGIVLDENSIDKFLILKYTNEEKKSFIKALKKFKDYQSPNPNYFNEILIQSSSSLFLLIITLFNRINYFKNIETLNLNLKQSNNLCINYLLFSLVIILSTIIYFMVTLSIIKRKHNIFKKAIVSLTIINYISVALFVWLSILFDGFIIYIIFALFFILIVMLSICLIKKNSKRIEKTANKMEDISHETME